MTPSPPDEWKISAASRGYSCDSGRGSASHESTSSDASVCPLLAERDWGRAGATLHVLPHWPVPSVKIMNHWFRGEPKALNPPVSVIVRDISTGAKGLRKLLRRPVPRSGGRKGSKCVGRYYLSKVSKIKQPEDARFVNGNPRRNSRNPLPEALEPLSGCWPVNFLRPGTRVARNARHRQGRCLGTVRL